MTTTLTSDEREEQLKQIRERLAAHRTEVDKYRSLRWADGDALRYHKAPDDVELLLSLIDSQAAGGDLARVEAIVNEFESLRTSPSLIDVEVSYDYLRGAILKTQSDAATQMRNLCAEKVREMKYRYKAGYGIVSNSAEACDEIIAELESLSLDNVEQKK